VRALDVFDAPEHERVVDPRPGAQADVDAVAGEDGEVVADERGLVPEHRRPTRHGSAEVPRGRTTFAKPLNLLILPEVLRGRLVLTS